ncbi:MAG: Hemolysin-type calcium binding protein [uncultured Sulfurovum sp.]|uniref:Hemolysin-type calcium binding protein n=1 Tax=uncultured Sulfurovum sp. TaxID=269237 RepID=A0A6S6TE38_9BACT|nr:MAG: Hemolysin-type calcium binding protein [uncultured Sulfurovum sp.]
MKKHGFFKSLVLASILFSVGTASLVAGDELIQNGSFENFSIDRDKGKWKIVQFDNWTGQGEVWNHALGRVATNGMYKAELDVYGRSVNTLSQTITTVNGETYTFSLDAYARKANSSDFELLVDGSVVAIITPARDWGKYGVEFTGNGAEQTIAIREIAGQDNGLGTVLDNVSVQSGTSLDQLKAQDRAKYEIMEPSGIGQIQEIISNDRRINSRVNTDNITLARDATTAMNNLIKEAIVAKGLANDGVVSISDTKEINLYLVENHSDKWAELRAAYALIENRRDSHIIAMNANAIRNVWGQIYNLGFAGTNKNRHLTSANGRRASSFTTVGYHLGLVLKNDILSAQLNNPEYQEVVGTTGTGLDMFIDVMLSDTGLLRKVPTSDLRAGAQAADGMNQLIVKAILEEGLGNDGKITTADVRTINNYIVANDQVLWIELHGDDEGGEETGYHRVQNDGATTRMFADNVMNTIADGIYHLGFTTNNRDRLLNEDGNKNQRFEKVAWWLDTLLRKDLEEGRLTNAEYKEIEGTTGTTFDKIVPFIYNDEGLLLKISMEDIRAGAYSANGMNEMIVEAIKNTGAAEDSYISIDEVRAMNEYLVTNYQAEWAELHGDDENDEETGYHRIQNDGARGIGFNRNIINNLADGVYHLGFPTDNPNRLQNEDGNNNVSFANVAYWLNKSLKGDFSKGAFD